ncbi:MAG TPA: efflux RND transporter periplasmic adaptor subunit, partial [Saprospiraceae bacterium]|nr:efflux RND transporter periplasmic adaptor subunit [Saprospiraceae bacterium]
MNLTSTQLTSTNSVMSITTYIRYFFSFLLVSLLIACGASSKKNDPLAELSALKDQRAALETKISALQADLEAKGLIEKKLRTIAISEVKTGLFRHYIDLQGRVDADESVAATSRIPGTLKRVLVDNGDYVKKGQLMAEMEDAVMLKSLDELEGQLAVATDLYNRQKALWDQNIGSEVQYIQAKNGKESLERSIATLKENWSMTKIYAPQSGTVDMVMLKQGQAIAPGIPLCNILNLDKLLIKGEV